ncbi:O-antigen ligase [uncultured Psychrobacter sp.]|uniref:O-antigen ligase family protein n=1 Tax=uncultured Psychrobacter sp. TaxID=259303 RepID=UPI00260DC2FD|nr:O-antigen ligase family protein [uncultured Psychrobacter sp.]
MSKLLIIIQNKELLIALYFLLFILGFTTGFSYSFYNEYRFFEIVVLLTFSFNAIFNKQFVITKLELLFLLFLVVGGFFWQQPIFSITELLLVYLLYKSFQVLDYNNVITRIIILSTFLLFLLLPLSLFDYIKTGNYEANWYPLPWNIRVYNSYFLVISILSTWLYLAEEKYKIFYLILLFLAFFAVLLDGGRSVTIAYTVFIVFMSLAYRSIRWHLVGVYTASWLAYLSLTYYAISSRSSELRILRTATYERLDLLVNAYNCWLQSPILGCGFYQLENYKDIAAHPHNLYLQVLSETGLVGFSFLVYVIIIIVKNIEWQNIHSYFAVAGLLAISIDFLFSGVHIYPVTQMALLWLFIFLLKNPIFPHAQYYNRGIPKASPAQYKLSVVVFVAIAAWLLYIGLRAFTFGSDMPMTPPRFWVYGYKLF